MTREEVKELLDSSTEEKKREILDKARKLRPVSYLPGYGKSLFWIDPRAIHNDSFPWNPTPLQLRPVYGIEEVKTIRTYHYGTNKIAFRPRAEECIIQCPQELIDEGVTAFSIDLNSRKFNADLDCFECDTTYYKTVIPVELRNLKIAW